MAKEQEFLDHLRGEIESGRLQLPTLPEVALNVRDMVERDDTTAGQVAEVVATDAALSARLLQVVNSPLYRGRNEIDNIQMAVTRLGSKLVRNLVTSLVMKQMFQAGSDALDKRLRAIWEHSVQVAGISRVLATGYPGLQQDQAMLAGLIHDIGALPILVLADTIPELVTNGEALDHMVETLHPQVGKMIMDLWEFPEALAAVPSEHEDLARDPAPAPDYVDVVLVANLQSRMGTNHPHAHVNWAEVPAFQKLGLEAEVVFLEAEGVAEEVEEVGMMLAS